MPRRNDISKVMIIGSGPIVIGQACEFDYSGTQACKALQSLGYEIVLVNSNPATIMTDPGIIYYESYKVSQRVGGLRNAIYDIEPDWRKLRKTQYRYGASLRSIKKSYYGNLLSQKMEFGPCFGRPLVSGVQP